MQCLVQTAGTPFPCGQCLPCRINRRRKITARLVYEARKHDSTSFLTLTYSDPHLPDGYTLVPEHISAWRKRFAERLRSSERKFFRYYLIGEYGDKYQRPHYHAILFGVSPDYRRLAYDCWQKCEYERCSLDPFTVERAQYIAGYVTKKMTKKTDPRLGGRHPEFARMSLKPGLGADAMLDVSSALLSNYHASALIRSEDNVPNFLKSDGRILPFDRYLRGKLIENVGLDTTLSGKLRRETRSSEIFRQDLLSLQNDPSQIATLFRSKGLEPVLEYRIQKARSAEARFKINQQGRKL